MNNPFEPEDKKPFDFDKEEKAAKNNEEISTDSLITSLRADMLPASEAEPETKSTSQQINIKLIVGLFIGVVLIGIAWYWLGGPGRSVLEKKLAGLVKLEATTTQAQPASPTAVLQLSPVSTNTPIPSPTLRPTSTQEVVSFPSPTPVQPTATPILTATSESTCRDAQSITLADVGKTLCVRGVVIETITNPSNFMVIFSKEKGAFYLLTYDLVWSQGKLDTCYQVEGKIDQIANSPILIFGYQNLPEVCP